MQVHDDAQLRHYWQNFGGKGDIGFLATAEGQPIGAAWARIMTTPSYGRIDDQTPEVSIAVVPEWRGKGVGTDLLDTLIDGLANLGYRHASLSVQKENPAVSLYKRFGFAITRIRDTDYVMVRGLTPIDDTAA